ncbi:hypothetical protein [Mesorhizobium sp. KR9-304]|uniref:hypothetical protein n=1 Tax=Mesorhizobium sp. KR9-304 TaxID=3156614 RepID=UPI0032B3135D
MKPRHALAAILAVASGYFFALPAALSADDSPIGAYLWFPEPGGPKSEQDCHDLVARVKPSKEKAEMSLWGWLPENDPSAGSFYLLLSKTRMEPTYGAEGDYDSGTVTLGETVNGETAFTLIPDDHPDTPIKGTIMAKPDSSIVVVTLRGIPADAGTTDRTTYFCRFEGGIVT